MTKQLFLVLCCLAVCVTGFSQIRDIPKVVEDAFEQQYKDARNVEYKDQLVRVDVSFELDGESMIATYNNKGVWKETQQAYSFDTLSEAVKDGFNKSKYADKEPVETVKLHLPGGAEQYRIRVKKNEVEKRYLFFNLQGRLLRESFTL